jgi:peptidoglycan hydrolase-like protein with peptidoglycan-binding domain
MQHTIADSLAKIRSIESKEVLNEAAVAAPAAAVAGKGIGRFIPGVGAALGAYDAYGRAKQGDWAGAGLSALGGAASLIPGVGTAASLGIAGAQALRDKQRTGSYMPGDAEIAAGVAKDAAAQPTATAAAPSTPTPAGADPKVLALQKQLLAKGAKITADGKMGPATQTAMKQFPGVAVAEQNKGNDMSESQRIAELRDRLAQLESQPQIADEGIADLAKGAWQGVKNMGSAFKAGVADPAGAKALAPAATKAGEKAALKTGAAVAKNPGKVAAAGAAAGAAGMAALGGAAATKPTNKPPAATTGAPAAGQTPNAGPDKADVDALNAMAAELENSQDPADIELMKRYNGIINAINNGAPDDKRTVGQRAANADVQASGL